MKSSDGRWLKFDAATVTQFHKDRRSNKTGFLGVRYVARDKRYQARIRVHGQHEKLYIGSAATPEEAARMYDAKARELYGPGAVVNFPESLEPDR